MKLKEKAYTVDDLLNKASEYIKNEEQLNIIKKAYSFAYEAHFGDKRLTGDDFILHPLNVALILTEIYADYETLATALLHDVINFSSSTLDDVEKEFGPEIRNLVDGISKINKLSLSAESNATATYYKKILIGLSKDVRIIILKIADRLHNMRTLWAIPENKRKEKAIETLEILVPIAHGLGINHIKSELEDLCLKYYKPEVYNDIVEKLNETRAELDLSVDKMMQNVSKILTDSNIPHEMKGRSKSVYSIYKKLQKGKTFNEIYDILALRFFVNTEAECYLALGAIHAKFKPVPRRFKDYIARPKPNGYQSLHTTVFGVDGKLFEIQIRTYDMDYVAEFGFASHWSYKEGTGHKKNNIEKTLLNFRNIIELNEQQVESEEEFVNAIKTEVFNKENIYVYTPKGDVFELPNGSTPIDFAYRVHTSIGHQMVGAMVNNMIAPLNYKLRDGDIVKINTNKNSKGPSKEWLTIAYTASAKSKIKSFFTKVDREEVINKGKESLTKIIKRKKLSLNDVLNNKNIELVLNEYNLPNEEELYYEIGIGKYNPTSILKFINGEDKEEKDIISKIINNNISTNYDDNDILVDNLTGIKVSFGGCCMPVYGDDIIGYISKGNGITVHRKNCHNILDENERIVNVKWNNKTNKKYLANVLIYALKKDNILADIITKTTSLGITVKSINTISNNDLYTFDIDILVSDKDSIDRYINVISNIKDVNEVERGSK